MTSAYDRALTVQTLGEGEGSQESASRGGGGGGEFVVAEVKFLHFKHPARFDGISFGRPDC